MGCSGPTPAQKHTCACTILRYEDTTHSSSCYGRTVICESRYPGLPFIPLPQPDESDQPGSSSRMNILHFHAIHSLRQFDRTRRPRNRSPLDLHSHPYGVHPSPRSSNDPDRYCGAPITPLARSRQAMGGWWRGAECAESGGAVQVCVSVQSVMVDCGDKGYLC